MAMCLKKELIGIEKYAEKERLMEFRKALINLGDIPSGNEEIVMYLIDFLDITSSFQDCGRINHISPEFTQNFHKLIYLSGRDKNGINRTQKNEICNLSNIWIGNVCGLPPKTAQDWINAEDSTNLFKICKFSIIPFLHNRKLLISEINYIIAHY